jgi:hypothetical protein
VARISDGAASGALKQLGGDLVHRWREPGPGAGGSGAGGLPQGAEPEYPAIEQSGAASGLVARGADSR